MASSDKMDSDHTEVIPMGQVSNPCPIDIKVIRRRKQTAATGFCYPGEPVPEVNSNGLQKGTFLMTRVKGDKSMVGKGYSTGSFSNANMRSPPVFSSVTYVECEAGEKPADVIDNYTFPGVVQSTTTVENGNMTAPAISVTSGGLAKCLNSGTEPMPANQLFYLDFPDQDENGVAYNYTAPQSIYPKGMVPPVTKPYTAKNVAVYAIKRVQKMASSKSQAERDIANDILGFLRIEEKTEEEEETFKRACRTYEVLLLPMVSIQNRIMGRFMTYTEPGQFSAVKLGSAFS